MASAIIGNGITTRKATEHIKLKATRAAAAAREEAEKATTLRGSAPEFVPGQQWGGVGAGVASGVMGMAMVAGVATHIHIMGREASPGSA